ncbi:hypothetical protein CBS9595_001584 [Malassezia furfur]|nr:hypothetical protein CBS9595_001584 [Malassezia furfur]
MQADDFVLFDDGTNPAGTPSQGTMSSHDSRTTGFNKPSFLQYRGQLNDTSPVLDEAPYNHFAQLGQADPMLMQRAMRGGDPYATAPNTAHARTSASPNSTPPEQPSSGTLGTPLTMLSLQGDDRNLPGALFPDLGGREANGQMKPNSYLPPKQTQAQHPLAQGWPYPPNQAPSKDTLEPDVDQPFLWNMPGHAQEQWKPWGPTPPGVANADMLRAAADQAGQGAPRPQGDDRLTVSPRELYLDADRAATRNAGPNLFPSQNAPPLLPPRTDDDTLLAPPFGLSSAMEGGSSTEEEDDEDERPFPSSSYAGSVLGATAPNEQLLEQWSRSMYGPAGGGGMPSQRVPPREWAVTGPSFSAMSTSSESEEDTPARPPRMGERLSGHAAQFANTVPGALGGYGYIPGSQESGMSVQSNDLDSTGGSQMSASMTESDTPGHNDRGRSPSILNTAQAITPAPKRASRVGRDASDEEEATDAHARPSRASADAERPRQLRSSSNTRRKSSDQDVSGARLSAGPSSDSSSPENDESDYEQSQLAHHTPRAANKRGRATRGAGGHARTASGQQSPTGATADVARAAQASSSSNSSAIRCDYVSPITGQRCGTVFHRMYDLARHRITLHLREEAQLVKEGKLKVEQCVVLGKEVDVKKALAELEWICRVCGASFSRKDAMLRHERLRHHR